MVPALPMQQSEIIAGNPEPKQTWESVNHLYERLIGCEEEKKKKQELREVAGHIQLACKLLSIRLKAFIQRKRQPKLKQDGAMI